MNVRSTIVAFVLACISVAAALLVWRAEQRSGGREEAFQRLLAGEGFQADRVDAIALRRRDEPTLRFERRDGRWEQVEPIRHPVDSFSIEQFVQLAERLQSVDVVALEALSGTQSLKALALSPPLAELTYAWDGREVTLQFGHRGFAGRAYLRIAGHEPVYVVDQQLYDRAVIMDPKEWRDRSIFTDVSAEADSIVRVMGADRLKLERQRRQWRMLEPVQTRVGPLAFDDYITALARARCAGFIVDQPDDLTRFGLAAPLAMLEIATTRVVQTEEGAQRTPHTQRLLVGSSYGVGSEDHYAMVEGRDCVILLSRAVLTSLFRRPELLVDPTALGVRAADVKSIRIFTGGNDFKLVRDLERWVAPDHGNAEANHDAVESFLHQLTELRAEGIRLAEFPLESQVGFVTAFGFDARPLDTVRIARSPESDGTWWLDNGDNVQRVFPSGLKMTLSPEDFGLQPGTR